MKQSAWPLRITRVLTYAALAAVFFYLFYMQATGVFSADLLAHIKRALAEGKATYSLVQMLLGFSWTQGGPIGAAAFLTVVEIATLVFCEQFMRQLLPKSSPWVVFFLSLAANFIGALYIPVISPHIAQGMSLPNVWHNSTYLGMKLFSLIAVWAYLRFMGVIESKNKIVDWVVFCIFVIASAAVKPSFVIVFGPTVVILCIVALVREGVSSLKRSLALAVPFFAIIGILLYQYTVLFTEVSSSGIGFGFAVVWQHNSDCVPLSMLQSYAFPLLVLALCWRNLKDDYNYRMSLIMFVLSLCVFLFVNETGERIYDGNFGWTLKFGVYYWVISSIVVFARTWGSMFEPANLIRLLRRGEHEQSVTPTAVGDTSQEVLAVEGAEVQTHAQSGLRQWFAIIVALVFVGHVFTGLWYFVRLLTGHGF